MNYVNVNNAMLEALNAAMKAAEDYCSPYAKASNVIENFDNIMAVIRKDDQAGNLNTPDVYVSAFTRLNENFDRLMDF